MGFVADDGAIAALDAAIEHEIVDEAAIFEHQPVGTAQAPLRILAHIPAIAAPILLVASAEDRLTPPGHARRMAAAAPRAQLLLLPGSAHPAVLNDRSGEAIRAVMEFVGRLT